MIKYLASDPAPELEAVMDKLNLQIHLMVTDVLQVIIQRGELDQALLNKIQISLLSRLLVCISKGQLDLQNKLLHALHATFQSLSAFQRKHSRISRHSSDLKSEKPDASSPQDTLLLLVLQEGISRGQDSATIHYWVDFLFMSVPQLKDATTTILLPLVATLGECIERYIAEIEQTYDKAAKGKKPASNTTDSDFVALIGALERLVLLVMEDARGHGSPDLGASGDLNSGTESGGFLGYVTGVLGASEGIKTSDGPKVSPKPLIRRSL